jgi:hypothetical protein
MGSPHFVTACQMRASMKTRNIPWLYASPEYLRPCWRSSTRLSGEAATSGFGAKSKRSAGTSPEV